MTWHTPLCLIERLKQRDRAAASEPEPAQDDTIELVRAPSARTARRQQREARLRAIAAEVEDTSASAQPLIRTPSAVADMQAAAADQHSTDTINQIASRAQRLRKHLRLVDAELAEVNAELVRARVLRGASGQRRRQWQCPAERVTSETESTHVIDKLYWRAAG